MVLLYPKYTISSRVVRGANTVPGRGPTLLGHQTIIMNSSASVGPVMAHSTSPAVRHHSAANVPQVLHQFPPADVPASEAQHGEHMTGSDRPYANCRPLAQSWIHLIWPDMRL